MKLLHRPLPTDSKGEVDSADDSGMTATLQDAPARTDRAALQHARGTIAGGAPPPTWPPGLLQPALTGRPEPVTSPDKPREFFIQGLTLDGQTFRPSDWAERLAGAMSCFRPDGAHGGIGSYIGYSPYCVPRAINGVKCVIVNEALKAIEPMAWDFVMHFARDNRLQLTEACLPLDPPKRP